MVTGVLVVDAVVVGGVSGAFGGSGSPRPPAGGAYHTSTAAVTRRSLESQTSVNATLGYAGLPCASGKDWGALAKDLCPWTAGLECAVRSALILGSLLRPGLGGGGWCAAFTLNSHAIRAVS